MSRNQKNMEESCIMSTDLNFSKISCKGTSYEIGSMLGELLEQNPELRKINIETTENGVDSETLKKKLILLKEFCPNVIEEANAVSDRIKIPISRLAVFNDSSLSSGACSQMAALPSITKNGHLLIGRSYEFVHDDEKNLVVIDADNYPAHIGFSLFLFGRFDGINEHGLTVTMSSCEFGQPSYGEGLWFPLVLRAILDNCTKVDEAVYLLKQMPVRCCANILIADRYGDAVLAEIICYGDNRKISLRRSDEYLISTNHYVNYDMLKYDNNHGKHSEMRYQAIEKLLRKEKGEISESHIKSLLSKKIPNDVCCSYYEDGLGTLHSMLFDLTDCTVDICFGSPNLHMFERVSFNEPVGISLFNVPYKNEFPQNPNDFWQTLPREVK